MGIVNNSELKHREHLKVEETAADHTFLVPKSDNSAVKVFTLVPHRKDGSFGYGVDKKKLTEELTFITDEIKASRGEQSHSQRITNRQRSTVVIDMSKVKSLNTSDDMQPFTAFSRSMDGIAELQLVGVDPNSNIVMHSGGRKAAFGISGKSLEEWQKNSMLR